MIKNETIIPTKVVGPIKINSPDFEADISVPLATFETPLWYSVVRGAKVSMLSNGINARLIKDCMTRSVLVEADDIANLYAAANELPNKIDNIKQIAEATSAFVKLDDMHLQLVGNLLYMRFSFFSGDASGHNMATKASEAILQWMLDQYSNLRYVSLSGNYCVDKKVSAVNSILGRGKYVIADIKISEEICKKHLRTTPAKIVDLNVKKNLLGSIISGSLNSANAHYANMLLAIYLATGQDAANIVEGSQGITHAELRGSDLYFSVTLPNIIVGTVGSGKNLEFAQNNLQMLGCLEKNAPGKNAQRLAIIVAATVLCGELSLLAALTNQDELMRGHECLERIKGGRASSE